MPYYIRTRYYHSHVSFQPSIMIGSGLIRFHPSVERPQDGYRLTDTAWKTIKEVGPVLLRDVIMASAEAGLKGLKTGVKGNQVNWEGGLAAAKQGAKQKAKQELNKLVKKEVCKSIFGF